MLCGLLEPNEGSVQLTNEHRARTSALRAQIGYMSQKFSLYDDLPVDENLEFFATVYGLSPEERTEKIRWALDFSGLENMKHQAAGSLPGGWKQRIAFSSAIMHEPSIVFLDEPTSGVDPLARRAIWALVDELADAGTAILVTTHYLDEAEQCNRLGFMAGGELILEGTPSELKARQSGRLLEFNVDQPQAALELLRTPGETWRVSLFGNRLHVVVDDLEMGKNETVARLGAAGMRVASVRETRFSIEDVFIRAVERASATR
jgi:ABC-2 type transport system ATP-binding protein